MTRYYKLDVESTYTPWNGNQYATYGDLMKTDLPSEWVGVDLDGTLAYYDRWRGEAHIGAPIKSMITRVKLWLEQGINVKIFTARAAGHNFIEAWCVENIGTKLEITNKKDHNMTELWDDRAVRVVSNSGQLCCSNYRPTSPHKVL